MHKTSRHFLRTSGFYTQRLVFKCYFETCYVQIFKNLTSPGVTHFVPTAFIMNAVGTEWVTPGLPRMDFGSRSL